MKCENRSTSTGDIVSPRCWDNDAEYSAKVIYNEVESDILYLCSTCAEALRMSARRQGYDFEVQPLNVSDGGEG